jgi:hypothetical protein
MMMTFSQITRRALCAAVIAGALVASGPVLAAPPTPAAMQAAGKIAELTGATKVFSSLIPGVVEQSKLLFLQQNPGLDKDLNEIAAKMRADLAPRLSELNDHVAQVYAQRFTEQELQQLLAFYQSPIGKKMVAEQATVVNSSLHYAQDWANKLSDEVTAKMREELKKKGHAL